MERKEFIKKTILIYLGSFIFPKAFFGNPLKKNTVESSSFTFSDGAIIDLHCHPSLKMYMEGKKFWKRHWLRSPGVNIIHMQEDAHEFGFGTVRGILATHYLPEGGIEKEWGTIKFLWPTIRKLAFATADKIEHEDYSNFSQISTMIDTLENQLHAANEKLAEKQQSLRFVIVSNYYDFVDALSYPGHETNTIPVAHAIEGAHALGRNLVRSEKKMQEKADLANTEEKVFSIEELRKVPVLAGEGKMIPDPRRPEELYIRNLELLHGRGVAMMTLSHFFANDISFPVEGIDPAGKKLVNMTWKYSNDAEHNLHLTDIGHKVVERMLNIGMIVDLTHSTPNVREDVFVIRDNVNKARILAGKVPRPVIFSHVGAMKIFNDHDQLHNEGFGFYNVSDYEIEKVCAYGGVMGVIPENFWLVGSDTNPNIDGVSASPHLGIPYVIETMKYLNSKSPGKQEFDNIAIGTDFDGLATNPKDLYLNRQLADLVGAMAKDKAFTPEYIAKIMYGNARRVLENGWGEGPDRPTAANRHEDQ